MEILVDGWHVFLNNRESIIILLVTIWGLGRWGLILLFDHQELSTIKRILITINLGALLMTWFAFFVILMGQLSGIALEIGSVILPLAGIILWMWAEFRSWGKNKQIADFRTGLLFGICFLAYLIMRLAFMKSIILPPYDDSPEHYLIIRSLLDPRGENPTLFYTLNNILQHYYHFGFHAIAAWLSNAAGVDPSGQMILLGQVFIVFSSLSVFMLILEATESIPAGLVAAAFAAFAWKMPSFAANWGKYPAITGLAFLPGWLGLLLLSIKSPQAKSIFRLLVFPISIGLGVIHTRLIICMLIIGLSIYLSSRVTLYRFKSFLQTGLLVGLALVTLLGFIRPISVYYSSDYFLPLGAAILMLPAAASEYPRHVFAVTLSMVGIWIGSKIPLFFEGYGATWLDPPFIELMLYIPLSVMVALGTIGVLNKMSSHQIGIKMLLIIILVLLSLSGLHSGDPFSPDKCCNYVTGKDLDAISWLGENASPSAVVWISGFKPKNYMLGTDAGIWISPLTGKNVNKLRYDFDWNSPSVIKKVCREGYRDVFIYKGAMPYSFDSLSLSLSHLVELVYRSETIKIYRIRCDSG